MKQQSRAANREVIKRLMQISRPTAQQLNQIKIQTAEKYRSEQIPSNSQLLQVLRPNERRKLLPVLRRKVTRTTSGVTVVAAMTRPFPCPQAEPCAYCPGGPSYGTPQSYTGYEPAAMRGLQNKFNPYRQVANRINQLTAIGHCVDKIELIVMGGTFPATPLSYQRYFVRRCLDAITRQRSRSLEQARQNAERSRTRNVGITVETRPDWAKRKHVDKMLWLGVTRVELGVQNIYDDVYELVGREHTVQDVVEATQTLKDAGLKVAYHMMPGLPGSSFSRDLQAFGTIFSSDDFKPDMIKIYPCLVLKGTKAYAWWSRGEYTPYTTEEAAELITRVKSVVPSWVRIMRVQRDIPANLIEAGVSRSNLREIVLRRMRERNMRCRCIRCREVSHRWIVDGVEPELESIRVLTVRERASGGEDVFISAEDPVNDVLIGYLRLRVPSEGAHRREICSEPCSVVRELHVYGPVVPVGRRNRRAWQHRGFGSMLLSEAERVSVEDYDCRKVVVMSALGTRQYYRRFGYDYDGPYMSKSV